MSKPVGHLCHAIFASLCCVLLIACGSGGGGSASTANSPTAGGGGGTASAPDSPAAGGADDSASTPDGPDADADNDHPSTPDSPDTSGDGGDTAPSPHSPGSPDTGGDDGTAPMPAEPDDPGAPDPADDPSNPEDPDKPDTEAVTVAVSPATLELLVGESRQFTASVSGTTDTAVDWSLTATCPDACEIGTISPSGLYTPPDELLVDTVKVTATAQAEPEASASARVTLLREFSNRSFEGRFTFVGSGVTANGQFMTAGTLHADGEGGFTGTQDFISRSGTLLDQPLVGNYTIHSDGSGTTVLTSDSGSFDFALVLRNANNGFFVDQGDAEITLGSLTRQQAGLTVDALDGTYVFELSGDANTIGRLQLAGGSVEGGDQDIVQDGAVLIDVPVTGGSYAFDSATGRGIATVTSEATTRNFLVYPADQSQMTIVSVDPNYFVSGRLFRQRSGPFSLSQLSGTFAFNANGSVAAGGVQSIGRFDATAAGQIGNGHIDRNQPGAILDGEPLSGTFDIDTAGVGSVALAFGSEGANLRLRALNEDRLILLQVDPDVVVSGQAWRQQQQSFSNDDFKGSYVTGLAVIDSQHASFGVGIIDADGAGVFDLGARTSRLDAAGFSTPALSATGTYDTAASGRGTATLPNVSNNLRFQFTAPRQLVIIGLDADPLVNMTLRRQY